MSNTLKQEEYKSQWQTQLNDAINKIINREKFSYDLNGDALYQQYKNQAMMQGQQAMMDTMGQAAALTGGYGNSYAQTAGQQAYNSHLQQLNDKIPELYQMALSKYQMEGQDMYDQYSLLAGQEEQDYGRYQDQLGNWQTETSRLQNSYETERDYENWLAEFNEAVRQYNHDNGITTSTGGSTAGTTTDTPAGTPAGTPTGNPNPSPVGYDNGTVIAENIKKIQTALGVTADGKWGPASQAAAKAKWGVTSAVDAWQRYTGAVKTPGAGFEGSTYSEAVAYLKKNGVDGASAAGIMTANEFKRSTSSRQFTSYQEYLEYTCDKKIATK